MNNVILKFALLASVLTLTACNMNKMGTTTASNTESGSTTGSQLDNAKLVANTAPGSGGPIGGFVAQSMDSIDKSKLAHALDKPVGKSTDWTNQNSGATYSVMPTRKLTVNGNPFCRQYTTTVTRNDNTQSYNGTACVAADGSWTGA